MLFRSKRGAFDFITKPFDRQELVSVVRKAIKTHRRSESEPVADASASLLLGKSPAMEDVLRMIALNRRWMKNYVIVSGLARNPKTPLAVSLRLLPRLTDKDANQISTDRNVPDPLRTAARRRVVLGTNR